MDELPDESPRPYRHFSKGLALLALAMFALWSGLLVTAPHDQLLSHSVVDDAFYYLEIARRWGTSPWPSFDGVHVTTGFHPLWLWVLVPLMRLLDGSPWLTIRVLVGLSSVLMMAAVWRLARWVGALLGHEQVRWWIVVVGLASVGFARYGLMGMEGPLALLLGVLWLEEDSRDSPRWYVHGPLAALAMLARLDMVLLIAVALGLRLLSKRARALPLILRSGLLTVLVMTPYLAWNVWLTGHVSTISSATKAFVVKSEAAKHGGMLSIGHMWASVQDVIHDTVGVGRTLLGGWLMGPAAIVGGAYPSAQIVHQHIAAVALVTSAMLLLAGLVVWRGGRHIQDNGARTAEMPLGIQALAIAGCVHLALASVMLTGQAGPWYWGLETIALLSVGGWALTRGRLAGGAMLWLAAAQLLSMALALVGTGAGRLTNNPATEVSFSGAMENASEALDMHVPRGARVGSCNAGTLGFFARNHDVVNMDGLVNDWSLLDARKRGDIRGWMQREHIAWYADCIPPQKMRGYAAYLGYQLEDMRLVYQASGGACQVVVWKLPDLP